MNRQCRKFEHPAVFLWSSDSRYDVLKRILPSVLKFWGDCPYPFYVGMNTHRDLLGHAAPVLAPASEWQQEFAAQLTQIPENYVLVLLDEYLICSPVEQPRLTQVARNAITAGLPYLRLMPLAQSLAARFRGNGLTLLRPELQRIPTSYSRHCELQATLWRKPHLQSLLEKQQTRWEFEHQSISSAPHYALTHSPPIQYRRVVEHGRWLPDASLLLRRAGLPAELGDRPRWSKSKYVRRCLDRFRWMLLGTPPADVEDTRVLAR